MFLNVGTKTAKTLDNCVNINFWGLELSNYFSQSKSWSNKMENSISLTVQALGWEDSLEVEHLSSMWESSGLKTKQQESINQVIMKKALQSNSVKNKKQNTNVMGASTSPFYLRRDLLNTLLVGKLGSVALGRLWKSLRWQTLSPTWPSKVIPKAYTQKK